VIDAVSAVLVVAGTFFLAVSAFGLFRFPDFYTRAHVVAKSESLGVALVLLGIVIRHGGGSGTIKLIVLVAFALVANPTAIHALSRAHRLEEGGQVGSGELEDVSLREEDQS
jgi:multicomponent Na+:H+ antiporter subunit G